MDTKVCYRCNVEQPIENFSIDRRRKDGRYPACKECEKARAKHYYHTQVIVCPERDNKSKTRDRVSALKRHYGLTIEDYDRMVQEQGGVCAICRNPESRSTNGRVHHLCVDHDHRTGAVRGLLCRRCNRMLGVFKDDVTLLRDGLTYLERYECRKQDRHE